ncbi:unnamed protein product [Caenorhabditis angaria]|uniref:Uncharacterized protein n=1 Tax=Caenorhabditis angaria TaxID=860376 RepID=A0A9P1IKL9_9PELO|nr:unnamed protein product [Caenorhabditis angaria]
MFTLLFTYIFSFLLQNIHADLGQQQVENPTKFHFETTVSCDYFPQNQTWCSQIFHLEEDLINYDDFGVSKMVCFNGSYYNLFENRVEKSSLTWNFEIVIGVRHNCTDSGQILEEIIHKDDYRKKSDGKYEIQKVVAINGIGSAGQDGWNEYMFKAQSEHIDNSVIICDKSFLDEAGALNLSKMSSTITKHHLL